MADGNLTPNPEIRPTDAALFRAWLGIAATSFGGGNATLEIIRREFVLRRGWVTEDAFARDWALCQTAPGMNLIAMTILLGWGLRGGRGVALSMVGLLLPTGLATVALAILFRASQSLPLAQAAMRGVVPATAGIGLASSYRTVRPLLRDGFLRRSGPLGGLALAATVGLPVLGLATLLGPAPIPAILVGGAVVGALAWTATEPPRPVLPTPPEIEAEA